MTPKQILAVLVARWHWALVVLLLSVAGTTIVSTTMFKRYTASASVMLDARTPDQVTGGALNAPVSSAYLATQLELIASERVGRAVIRALDLTNDSKLREAWLKAGKGDGDFEAWLSESMQRNLLMKPAAVSNVITLNYTAEDGAKAAKLANAYVKAYMDISLELRMERARQYGSLFDVRSKELRGDLERAQEKLSEYQQKNGVLVGDEKVNVEAMRLAELGTQLSAAQSANAEVSGRLRQAGRQTDQLQEVYRNPAVASLSADLTREEVRLRELTARLGESHPQLIEQEARLTELKARLAAEKGRAVNNVGFDNSATHTRVSQIALLLEAQRTKVLRMQAQREQSMALQRDVENAQRAYDTMQQRVNQAGFESQNTQTNLSVLKNATVPMAPSSPNLLKNIGGSLALGALLGLGLVLGREQIDRRLRTVDDFAALKQTVLISLPVSSHASRIAVADTSRTQLMKQRVLTGLPRPTQQTT
jgi:polysaccharide biosynthesis transport protein